MKGITRCKLTIISIKLLEFSPHIVYNGKVYSNVVGKNTNDTIAAVSNFSCITSLGSMTTNINHDISGAH
jgi:hypothetical protein